MPPPSVSSFNVPPPPEPDSPPPSYLKHILTNPISYEIPLRTMYTNNVLAQASQTRASLPIEPSSGQASPELGRFEHQGDSTRDAGAHFKSCLKEQMTFVPSTKHSLPPSFITSFVRKCFTEELCQVDFTQAMTALDYLKILDDRRKRELSACLRRLDMDSNILARDTQAVRNRCPGICEWLSAMEDKAKKIETLYTHVYIGLRRWTLINEMRLVPFSKANCIAMLNTLYPPSYGPPPTTLLTDGILNSQRNSFFRYIQAVEKSGKGVLHSLENASRRPGDKNGWPVVRDVVDMYLRKANAAIDECISFKGPEYFASRSNSKRADSGVSFGSGNDRRPSTSVGSARSSFNDKPLPSQPNVPVPKKNESTFGRFARELRRIKSRSADSKDDTELKSTGLGGKRSLRMMRSTSALNKEAGFKKDGKHSRGNSSDRVGYFDIDEAQRERLIREAQKDKENRKPKRMPSPTHFDRSQSYPKNPYGLPEGSSAPTPVHELYAPMPELSPTLPQEEMMIAELSA